jgi:phospholipase/carboxylesterase
MTTALSIPAQAGAPTSLVVLLHGFGADAAGFHDIAKALAPSFPHAEFLTPDGFEPSELGGSGRQWFGIAGVTDANRLARVQAAGIAVSRWIDAQLDARHLPHDRVAILGFSQGAILGAWLAVHRAPQPSAVVMFSGRVAAGETPVANTVSTRVLIAHGEDDARIPIAELAPGAAALTAWGAHVTVHRYPGLGHSIDARELRDAREFLLAP